MNDHLIVCCCFVFLEWRFHFNPCGEGGPGGGGSSLAGQVCGCRCARRSKC